MTVYTYEGLPTSGTTAQRPAYAEPGFVYYDTTLNRTMAKVGAAGTDTWSLCADGPVNTTNLVAAGSSIATANNAMGAGFTIVTAADGTKGVKLPTAAAGKKCVLKNSANAVLKVYPQVSSQINDATANAAFNMSCLSQRTFVAFDSTHWYVSP